MEDLWKKSLLDAGWSSRAIAQIPLCYAKSTLASYNRVIVKYRCFCDSVHVDFPCTKSAVLTDFMCMLADSSDRPRSILRTAVSALSALFDCLQIDNPFVDKNLYKLQCALVKSSTVDTMRKSKVMPIEPFFKLFESWGGNRTLCTEKLRLKSITLLALCMMLRPSDIAPKAVYFDKLTLTEQKLILCIDQVVFEQDGKLTIKFLGIKNDTSRDGFDVTIPPASNPVVDPVLALKDYIFRTDTHRSSPKSPVFLQLCKPFGAISAATVSKILSQAIKMAGLHGQGYTAKSFRPTGASMSVAAGVLPETVMQIGRWKTKEVFFNHYVHKIVPQSFSDNLVNV